MQRHELDAAQWASVEAVLPRRVGRPSKAGDRHFVNAVLWIAKTGSPWRDLHPRFGPWKTIYNRFRSWAQQGLWKLNRVPPPRGANGAAPLPRDRGSPHGAPRGLPRFRPVLRVQWVGSGGSSWIPPAHRNSIAINGGAEWKPKARRATILMRPLMPSTTPFVMLCSM